MADDLDLPELIGNVDFNYDEDRKEFCENPHGKERRLVDLCGGIDEDYSQRITLSFKLGRKSDDTISISFNATELINKIQQAVVFGEDSRKQ